MLRPDLDQIEALAPEREALWPRIEAASFLTRRRKAGGSRLRAAGWTLRIDAGTTASARPEFDPASCELSRELLDSHARQSPCASALWGGREVKFCALDLKASRWTARSRATRACSTARISVATSSCPAHSARA